MPHELGRRQLHMSGLRDWSRLAVLFMLLALTPVRADSSRPTAYEAAQTAVSLENYGEAAALLAEWLLSNPGDETARFLRARVLAWSGNYNESIEEFDLLLTHCPSCRDYIDGKANTLTWREDVAKEAVRTRHLQLETGLARERLSNGLPDWSSAVVQLDYHYDTKRVVYAAFRRIERFDLADEQWSVGAVVPIAEDWVAGIDASVAPNANVLPRVAASIGLQRALGGGWGVGLVLRHSSYKSTYGDVASLSAERYWKAYRFAYRVSTGKAEDAARTYTHEIRSDFYYHELNMVGLSIAIGRESESIGIDRLITSDVSAASLQGLHWFAEDWAVRWRVGYHQQGTLYNRAGVDVSLRHRF